MTPSPSTGSLSVEGASAFDPARITRPDRALLQYYLVTSLLTVVAFPFVFLPLFFKYHTLKFQFQNDGVSMCWGVLFRKEIHLTYRRIQDIHLTRNLIQRWMGLATVGIQTASGSAGPEMSIEGVLQAEQLRDYLYAQMRGAKGDAAAAAGHEDSETRVANVPDDEALALLREIRDALQRLAGGQARS